MYDPPPFQRRVQAWLMECFSMEVCRDKTERNHRFLEESLELVQALGCTKDEAHQLVDYVFGRRARFRGDSVLSEGQAMTERQQLLELAIKTANPIKRGRLRRAAEILGLLKVGLEDELRTGLMRELQDLTARME